MVSERSNLRPAGVEFAMADLLIGAGSSFKELRKAKTSISDLQKIIDDHFNVPHVRIGETRNGSLYLTGLFDAVPDGVESQDHEAFDEIILLLGWIEGVFGLPEHSRSIVPKLFDDSPILEEGADLQILDDSEASVTNGGQILASYELPANQLPDEVNSLAYSWCKVPLDLDEKPDLAGSGSLFDSDVMLIEEKVRFDENRAKIRPTDESVIEKDAANLDAYQVFDEMPTREGGHEFSSDVLTLHKSILETYVNSNFYLELHCFDPGGQVMLGDSWIANMKGQYNQDALKVFEMLNFECFDPGGLMAQRVFNETPRSLINFILHDYASFVVAPEIWVMCFDPGGSLCVFERDLTKQGRIVVRLIFDPGEVFKDCRVCDADYVTEFVFDPGGREHSSKFALASLSLRLMKRIALSYNGPRLEVFNSSLGMNVVLGSISKGCAVHLYNGVQNFGLGLTMKLFSHMFDEVALNAIDMVKRHFVVLIFDPGGEYFNLFHLILEAKDLSKRGVMIQE